MEADTSVVADQTADGDEDFIAGFQRYTETAFSPELFCKWAGIFLVGSALERRVWVRTGNRKTFPNLYLFLVAPPGVGKQVIDDAKWFGKQLSKDKPSSMYIAPDSMTTASLVDDLLKAGRTHLPPSGPPISYHSLALFAEEIGVMLPNYDGDFLGKLNKLFNNPEDHVETRRHGPAKEVSIAYPQLNILAGVQPGWMSETLPETAWSTGLTSRVIMVYSAETPYRELFAEEVDQSEHQQELLVRLRRMTRLYGEASVSPDAAERLRMWHKMGGPPTPRHSKLEHYARRRTNLHVIKLSLIAAVSRSASLHITLPDVNRAVAWLLEAEALMPDIFRAMVGRSDAQVVEELHFYLTGLWRMSGMKPVHEDKLYHFLHQRVPSEKIEKILQVAERSNVIARMAGTDMYVPKAKHEFDIE